MIDGKPRRKRPRRWIHLERAITRVQKAVDSESPAAGGVMGRELISRQSEDLSTPVVRQHFSLGVMSASLELVVVAGTHLRRVGAVLSVTLIQAGDLVSAASYYSVRLWLLRMGLYELMRPKQWADDWIWIVDHTLQMGDCKCLIIVGIRQTAWDALDSRVLTHEDVELIDLQPVKESNGEVVCKQLRAAAKTTGKPRAIVSDSGSDLHAGIERFCGSGRQTVWMYDIKHKTACLLKRALEADSAWRPFIDEVNQFKKKIAQSQWAGLAPPQQRSKARYMNVDVLTEWGRKHLDLLESPKAMRAAGLKAVDIEAKLGWLRKYGPQLRRWEEMLTISGASEHYVRHNGIHRQAAEELESQLPQVATPAARRLRKDLLSFITEQSQCARENERLLGSSEVLESIIGKYKYMAGERSTHGMTGMVLSIGAFLGRHTDARVKTALERTTTSQVWEWCRSKLGTTVQSLRSRISNALAAEQKQETLRLENG